MKKGSCDPKVQTAMNDDSLALPNVTTGWEPILNALGNARKAFPMKAPHLWDKG